MKIITNNLINVSPVEKVRDYYRTKEGLFGMLSWEELLRRDSLGKELWISTGKIPDKVFINGKEYTPKPEN